MPVNGSNTDWKRLGTQLRMSDRPSPNPVAKDTTLWPCVQNRLRSSSRRRWARDQEMTCDECVADLAEFVEVQLTGKPRGDARRCTSIWRDVTIVPTSTTSCVRRLPPSLRKRGDDLAGVRPARSPREARVTNVPPMVVSCKPLFPHEERLFLCASVCWRRAAKVPREAEKCRAEVRCSTRASKG